MLINYNWAYFKNKTISRQILIILVLSFIVGVAIEIIQSQFGRDSSWNDVFLDVLGATSAIVFFSIKIKSQTNVFKWTRNLIITILFLYALMPLINSSSDELILSYQFPILSNLETPFELGRWDSRYISRSSEKVRSGNYSLKVNVAKYRYRGIGFNYFYRDWSTYKTFNISIYNTLRNSVEFDIKIYDEVHNNSSKKYDDRFNRTFLIHPGWNDLQIKIVDIQNGPKNRVMNLTKIKKVTIFPLKKQKPFFIYIDDVYLN